MRVCTEVVQISRLKSSIKPNRITNMAASATELSRQYLEAFSGGGFNVVVMISLDVCVWLCLRVSGLVSLFNAMQGLRVGMSSVCTQHTHIHPQRHTRIDDKKFMLRMYEHACRLYGAFRVSPTLFLLKSEEQPNGKHARGLFRFSLWSGRSGVGIEGDTQH